MTPIAPDGLLDVHTAAREAVGLWSTRGTMWIQIPDSRRSIHAIFVKVGRR